MIKFWLNNPNILLDRDYITEIFPNERFGLAQKLNAITRLVIAMTILGYLFTKSLKIIVSAVITLVVLVIIYKIILPPEYQVILIVFELILLNLQNLQ